MPHPGIMEKTMTTQAGRKVSVSSPLGEDVLMFERMDAVDPMSGLFEYQLELISEDHDIDLDTLLGKKMSVCSLLTHEERKRYFDGHVTRFTYQESRGRYASYRATLRPWLWFLTLKTGCRIFQNKTVPDIIKSIFQDSGFTDFEDRLSGSYPSREYCVQYRESEFNFVSRLMEEEGIYYYFHHDETKHMLVLTDSLSGHDLIPDYEQVPYYPPDERDRRERDNITHWRFTKEARSGEVTLRDFNFKKPKANLEAKSKNPFDHAHADLEVYDYPGKYLESQDGETCTRIRLEEIQSRYHRAVGQGNIGGFFPGGLFELTGYPRQDQNKRYLIVSTRNILLIEDYEASNASMDEAPCYCEFSAIEEERPFRPERSAEKPVVQGPQTAIVVGPAGEEIYPDEHGRVKVQFHWDREGKNDENSSCWIRVSHPWAGSGWGGIHTPRIGQEVIVDFIEGDPDRPIVTGRVYNGDNKPPYKLPDKKEISGVKSNSSKGGSGYNEFVMDDSKGKELIRVHGQYDMETTIENDLTEKVLNDRIREVTKNETIDIGKDLKETVDGNATQKVKGKVLIDSMQEIKLKVGGNTIVINNKGVTINGMMLQMNGKTKADLKAPMVNVQGSAMTNVKGGIVKIN